MSKKNRDLESIIDIYNASREISQFIDGIDRQDFQSDKEKRNATLYSNEVSQPC